MDTGGPLMCSPWGETNKVLMGILDQYSPACHAYTMKTSLFRDVIKYYPWIQCILEKDGIKLYSDKDDVSTKSTNIPTTFETYEEEHYI